MERLFIFNISNTRNLLFLFSSYKKKIYAETIQFYLILLLKNSQLRLLKLKEDLNHILSGCIKENRCSQEQLYNLHSSKMFGICLRYSKDYDTAKDILQEGFIKVFENIKQFSSKGSIEGWIRRIIINTALERFRKQKNIILVDTIPDVIEEEIDDRDPEMSMNEMMKMIQTLPDQYRLVFNLYVFEEMTHKEIAAELGIAEGTSKSDLSRARMILRHKITEKKQKVAKVW